MIPQYAKEDVMQRAWCLVVGLPWNVSCSLELGGLEPAHSRDLGQMMSPSSNIACPSCHSTCQALQVSEVTWSLSRWLWTCGKTSASAGRGRENGSSRRSTSPSSSSWCVPKA